MSSAKDRSKINIQRWSVSRTASAFSRTISPLPNAELLRPLHVHVNQANHPAGEFYRNHPELHDSGPEPANEATFSSPAETASGFQLFEK